MEEEIKYRRKQQLLAHVGTPQLFSNHFLQRIFQSGMEYNSPLLYW